MKAIAISNTCPFCVEETKEGATKCKHCESHLFVATPSHNGTCPKCKEDIHVEATVCKHCKTLLDIDAESVAGARDGVHPGESVHVLFKGALPLQPDGTIIYKEKCRLEPYWVCDANGCRVGYARVCTSYPEVMQGLF